MSLLAIFKLAVANLLRNRFRSFLTSLGVVIGVSSVITMIGLVEGASGSIKKEVAKLGTNLVFVIPGSVSRGGMNMGLGSLPTLTEQDTEVLLQASLLLRAATPWVGTFRQAVFCGRNWSTSVIGVNEHFLDIRDWRLAAGTNFTREDDRLCRRVCLIGAKVAENLFDGVEPVGQVIRIGNMPFRVLGVLQEKGLTGMGEDQDDRIAIPFKTAQRKLLGITHAHLIMLSIVSDEAVEQAKLDIERILRENHGIEDDQESDFLIGTQADIAKMAESTFLIIKVLLACVASVSLLVGGINIMNVMLVAVTERTREIGIRMAVGARRTDILSQFLVEAMSISLLGGGIGIFLGLGTTQILIMSFTSWKTTFSVPAVIISVLFSALVGMFFGLYPAWKASQLDPIEALRFE